MIKLPEQCNVALFTNYEGASEYRNLSHEYCTTSAKYSEAQLKQFGRDLLEHAAQIAEGYPKYGEATAHEIRALIKEMPND